MQPGIHGSKPVGPGPSGSVLRPKKWSYVKYLALTENILSQNWKYTVPKLKIYCRKTENKKINLGPVQDQQKN